MKKETESVVDKAKALRESAIDLAKEQLLEEITPKMKELFERKLEQGSKKILEQNDDEDEKLDISVSDEDEKKDEAEIDLDDLADELEKEDSDNEEDGDLEDRLSTLEKEVEQVKDDVDELVSMEKEEDHEELEIEEDDEDEDDEDDDIKESVDIAVHNDDVTIDITNASNEVMDYVDGDSEDGYIDIEVDENDEAEDSNENDEELDELEEIRRVREAKLRRENRMKRRFREQADAEKDTDVLVDIVDDENWSDVDAPEKVDWNKNIPSLENRIRSLKKRLNKERVENSRAKRIVSEVTEFNKKLTLVSKIFARFNLKKESKVKVLDMFDKTNNLNEAYEVYKKVINNLSKKQRRMNENKQNKNVLLEVARPIGSMPHDSIIEVERLKKLAGIKD